MKTKMIGRNGNSMKNLLMAALVVAATPAISKERVRDVVVYDHVKSVHKPVEVYTTQCRDVEVPIYGNTGGGGASASDLLGGMIIGGLIGGTASGKDSGAAAGAVIGGLIANDNANKSKSVIVGYQIERQCDKRKMFENKRVDVYSHSTIRFYLDGKRYVLQFHK